MQSLDFNTARAPKGGDDPELRTEPGDYVHMLYQTQLSKYGSPRAFNAAVESLSTHYGLEDNADLLLARADLLYTQCRFRDALAITATVLQEDKSNFPAYPVHLACLYELKQTNELFLVAHDLADNHPEHACTWLAVGTYYLATSKIADARRYFSKSSMMDATFGPAWIGFAHTFAAEGEHDQAITAYSTAARLFTGTHLPQVFLGMQNHAMNNMTAAEEYLKSAYQLCRADPLLLNEMGIVLYHQDRLKDAAKFFRQALLVADETGADPHAWLGARTNLGHAYRRLSRRLWPGRARPRRRRCARSRSRLGRRSRPSWRTWRSSGGRRRFCSWRGSRCPRRARCRRGLGGCRRGRGRRGRARWSA